MKFIHTADWHIGQTFFGYDRMEEHLIFLAWLKDQISFQKVELLLIAGDVFDSPNPSAMAQKTYYKFLRDVTTENPQLNIIITAGNHDSAARLEATNPLLEGMNIYVKGVVKRGTDGEIDYKDLIIELGDAYVLAVPFLRQGDYHKSDTYVDGVKSVYQNLYDLVPDKTKPIIAMGHLQATGSEVSVSDDSERKNIGGLDGVSPESFDGISYTALGHLHRAQRVSHRENVRYSGTPLPMSFAEKNNKQGVTLVSLEGKEAKIEQLTFEAPTKMLSIPKVPEKIDAVLKELEKLPEGEINIESPYLEIKVLITEPDPSIKHKIDEALKNKSVKIARIQDVQEKSDDYAAAIKPMSYEELKAMDPLEVARDAFKRQNNNLDMPNVLEELLINVINEVKE